MTRPTAGAWAAAVVLLSAIALSLVAASTAGAATKGTTTIEVRLAAPLQPKLPHTVVVHLTGPSGAAISGAEVSVYLDVKLFGGRSALLGKAVTDSSGEARVAITPDRASYTVRARFAGNDALAPSETVKTIAVPANEIRASAAPGGSPLLSGVRTTAPRVIAALVAITWLLLLVGSVWVLRRIHHHGTRHRLEPAGR
ncbi:MAG TPA: hypothetical protein VHN98_04620 [Acidimicrobiales bacterium]|nr:hypothetical protein [Acidimicrobiales bacterium]